MSSRDQAMTSLEQILAALLAEEVVRPTDIDPAFRAALIEMPGEGRTEKISAMIDAVDHVLDLVGVELTIRAPLGAPPGIREA